MVFEQKRWLAMDFENYVWHKFVEKFSKYYARCVSMLPSINLNNYKSRGMSQERKRAPARDFKRVINHPISYTNVEVISNSKNYTSYKNTNSSQSNKQYLNNKIVTIIIIILTIIIIIIITNSIIILSFFLSPTKHMSSTVNTKSFATNGESGRRDVRLCRSPHEKVQSYLRYPRSLCCQHCAQPQELRWPQSCAVHDPKRHPKQKACKRSATSWRASSRQANQTNDRT